MSTNFDRAVMRMRQRGHLPFTPDGNHGRAVRVLRNAELSPDLAAAAGRMDAIIAAFALGVMLGFILAGVLP